MEDMMDPDKHSDTDKFINGLLMLRDLWEEFIMWADDYFIYISPKEEDVEDLPDEFIETMRSLGFEYGDDGTGENSFFITYN